ncbi:MAG: beta-lactamase family protein [Deltaproteobacteria bacterium]|nr:beta-lactamase family protein [Deltaproteobacteria bacterium]MBW2087323.1 beta-lactamase family protein [Deltaproteobacteria bacterium]
MLTQPKEVGLSSERLGRIDQHLKQRYLDSKKIAGALTLVARRGGIAYFSPVGMMDLERGKPMSQDTIFRIYSMTKPITSVALMMLYEHGHFQLNDPVHKFIPEWRDLCVYLSGNYPNFLTTRTERPMTILDLMTHTSGLTYGFMERTNVDAAYRKLDIGGVGSGDTLREMIEKLAGLPLEFSPGTRWNYSVSTDVLAYLVEVISGMRFDEYLKTKIFEPLKMNDTDFWVPPEKLDRFAANYSRRPDKSLQLEDDPVTGLFTRPATFFSGGGGLVSTASDYFRFCQMLLNGGALEGVRILGCKTIELMTMNHLPQGQDLMDLSVSPFTQTATQGFGFGLGFSIHLGSARSQIIGSPGEYAWGGAASTVFWIDPVEDLIVIFLTQFMPDGTFNFRGQLKTLIYPAIID